MGSRKPRVRANVEVEILSLLADGGEYYGLQMVEKCPWLKRNSIYVMLQRMVKKGMVITRLQPLRKGEAGRPKRLYKIADGVKLAEIARCITCKKKTEIFFQERCFICHAKKAVR